LRYKASTGRSLQSAGRSHIMKRYATSWENCSCTTHLMSKR
jgi:hypothetical protein